MQASRPKRRKGDKSGTDSNSESDTGLDKTKLKNTNTIRINTLEEAFKLTQKENASLRKELTQLAETTKKLLGRVKELENKTQITNQITSAPQEPAMKPLFSNIAAKGIKKSVPTQNEINVLNAISFERKDIESREKNVLFMGVKSTTDEQAKSSIEIIFDDLSIDKTKIASVYRFKQNQNQKHPPIIKVCLNNKNDRLIVLKAGKALKNKASYDKVYINPDLTIAQRNLERELILERNTLNAERKASLTEENRKFYYGIRNGLVKEIQFNQ